MKSEDEREENLQKKSDKVQASIIAFYDDMKICTKKKFKMLQLHAGKERKESMEIKECVQFIMI